MLLPLGPVTISDRGAGASSRGPSPDRGRDRSRFKLVAGLGVACRRLGVLGRQDPRCGIVARVEARTGVLLTLRPRTPAPWSRPDAVVHVDRCSLICGAGTDGHPIPPLTSAGRARGDGTDKIMFIRPYLTCFCVSCHAPAGSSQVMSYYSAGSSAPGFVCRCQGNRCIASRVSSTWPWGSCALVAPQSGAPSSSSSLSLLFPLRLFWCPLRCACPAAPLRCSPLGRLPSPVAPDLPPSPPRAPESPTELGSLISSPPGWGR